MTFTPDQSLHRHEAFERMCRGHRFHNAGLFDRARREFETAADYYRRAGDSSQAGLCAQLAADQAEWEEGRGPGQVRPAGTLP